MSEVFRLYRKNVPICIIGLPNAGKTTFVLRIKEGRFRRPKPTIGVSFEQVTINDVNFTVFDLSGQEAFRETLWKSYVQSSYGIIFMIDSADKKSLDEAKVWYWKVIDEWLKELLADRVVLFIANKSDLKSSLPLDTIIDKLELVKMASYPNISFQIFKTSLRSGENINYALNWLTKKLRRIAAHLSWRPEAIFVIDDAGNTIFSYDTLKHFDIEALVGGYFKALSKFSDELLGNTVVKILKTDNWYSVLLEEKNFLVALITEQEQFLPEARRVGLIVLNYIRENKWRVTREDLEKYITKLFQ